VTTVALPRFDRVTRAVHWATAAFGLVVVLTGTILYVPELSAAIGRRAELKEVHVISGVLLMLPLALGVASGPAGRRLRADLLELSRWSDADRRWLRRRTRGEPDGKFNGGQKFVTAMFGGLFVMQVLTGLIMYWPNSFPDAWRTGATFVHDWAYLGLAAAVIGHVVKAVGEPDLMRAMMTGKGGERKQ
jgi:formate dehydrogenase subunit gamma